jgi:hypothetical protein
MAAKLGVLIAALGLVTILLERPQIATAPHRLSASVEQGLGIADIGSSSIARSAPDERAPGTSLKPATEELRLRTAEP